jgi:hypothetical protein
VLNRFKLDTLATEQVPKSSLENEYVSNDQSSQKESPEKGSITRRTNSVKSSTIPPESKKMRILKVNDHDKSGYDLDNEFKVHQLLATFDRNY